MKKKAGKLSNVLGQLPIIITIGFCLSIGLASYRSIKKTAEIQRISKEREELIEETKRENEELLKKISEEQKQEFIEKEIRNKLDYAKKGEVVLVLPSDEELKIFRPEPVEKKSSKIPNWKMWAWMFDISIK